MLKCELMKDNKCVCKNPCVKIINYNKGYEDAKKELFNQISEILSVEMADCKTCPIGCEVNTYGGCQEEIKKYLLEQIS